MTAPKYRRNLGPMKKLLLMGLFLSTVAIAGEKFLSYQYNKDVIVRIANVPCPIKTLKNEYPWSAVAIRSDGQYLFGCFNRQGDNDIVIQWAGGDKSVFPANYFLIEPNT